MACMLCCHRRAWRLTLQQRQGSRSARLFHRLPLCFQLPLPLLQLLLLLLLLLQLFKVALALSGDIVLSLTPGALPAAVEGGRHKQARSTSPANMPTRS